MVRSVINNILYSIEKGKTKIICDALSLMNMQHKIYIEIKVASKKIFNDLEGNENIDKIIQEKINKLSKQDQDKISKSKLIETMEHISFGEISITLYSDISLKNQYTYHDLANLLKYKNEINTLVDLHILKPIAIYFLKNDEKISFEECSSGEKHIIFAFSSIAINIQNNSIILIDEPEISLHPNWQMKYIHLLKKTFQEYASAHFILATHSHYIISDLESSTSSLVTIKRDADGENQKAELLQYDTYAWSAENIIYNVFGLRTTRNYYFEMDLSELINSMQSDPSDINLINRLYKKLKNYSYDKNDPLNEVLDEVSAYLEVYDANTTKD